MRVGIRYPAGFPWILTFPLIAAGAPEGEADDRALAENRSVVTLCAEHDNVNVPLFSPDASLAIASFAIEARHPSYRFDEDHGAEDFTNCPPPTHRDTFYSDPGTFLIHDDGTTAIIAVRVDRWWRPRAMTAIGTMDRIADTHYVALHREIDGGYPQVLVLYSDGNLRLKPFPPSDRPDVLFGSSVVVGPALASDRPFVDIASVEYRPGSDSFEIRYEGGASATLSFEEVSRERTRIRVETDFPHAPGEAFATFRSMYVSEGNTDVDRVRWREKDGREREDRILEFESAASEAFLFRREVVSRHNTSAPDIRIGEFEYRVKAPEFRRGDVDGAGSTELTDAIFLLGFLFRGESPPPCADAADADDSGALDLTDVIRLLQFLFVGGPPPPSAGACAPDPSEDTLDCAVRPWSCRDER